MPNPLELIPLESVPMVEPGDNLALLISESLDRNGLSLEQGDILVVAQKVVSKAENRYAYLEEVDASPEALLLAQQSGKDPRLVELILRESNEVVRVRPGLIIVEHRNGCVMANAGIDKSNIDIDVENPRVLLLPQDADRSARELMSGLGKFSGAEPPIIINDSVGRAWRNGTVGLAIGTAGMEPLKNQIGDHDLLGNVLEATEAAVADELAAAASLVMGQAAEGCPVVLARGYMFERSRAGAESLLRAREMDLFR